MVENDVDTPSRRGNRTALWTGRVLSGLIVLLFGASGIMKLMGGPDLEQGMKQLGLPTAMTFPLAIVELASAVLFLIPGTSVIGAILLTGYVGGTICTHWRVGDPIFMQIGIGIVIWLAISLREPRLWSLIPWKRAP
jgi:uncharacterized membrane protein YphA (DoxX/SURF4 family)